MALFADVMTSDQLFQWVVLILLIIGGLVWLRIALNARSSPEQPQVTYTGWLPTWVCYMYPRGHPYREWYEEVKRQRKEQEEEERRRFQREDEANW